MTTSVKIREYFPYSVQVRKAVWERLSLSEVHLDLRRSGKPRIMFFRELAARLSSGGAATLAGNLNLYSLQLTAQRHIVSRYLDKQYPELLPSLLAAAGISYGSSSVEQFAGTFCRLFPGVDFLEDPSLDPIVWIKSDKDRLKLLVTEILILSVAASNRALESFREVIDWNSLLLESSVKDVAEGVEKFLAAALPVAETGLTLAEILRLPLKAAPDSLYEQLKFMQAHWSQLLPAEILPEIMAAFALSEDEGRMFMPHGEHHHSAPVLEFGGSPAAPGTNDYYPEPERFSFDTDWMPNVVL